MLKGAASLKGFEAERAGAVALRELLDEIPWVSNPAITLEDQDFGFDIVAHFMAQGQFRTLLCEVKSDGQPRHVRNGVNQLRSLAARHEPGTALLMIAPYLSEEARRICTEAEVGYLDFEGNCRLVFDGVYIDRSVPTRPTVAKRDLRSLFKPKSAQILRALLREPNRNWKVVELAETAGVSLGHVSNVRNALVDREWAAIGSDGLRLTAPNLLLDEWRDSYEPPPAARETYYTSQHGATLDHLLRDLIAEEAGQLMLAGFNAAKWIAPFGRSGTSHVYADARGASALIEVLKLSRAPTGGNFVIALLEDDGLFRDRWVVASDIVTTSPVQTYLDLSALGERGREAAEHLRREVLPWSM